jgi:hypothetical protein
MHGRIYPPLLTHQEVVDHEPRIDNGNDHRQLHRQIVDRHIVDIQSTVLEKSGGVVACDVEGGVEGLEDQVLGCVDRGGVGWGGVGCVDRGVGVGVGVGESEGEGEGVSVGVGVGEDEGENGWMR